MKKKFNWCLVTPIKRIEIDSTFEWLICRAITDSDTGLMWTQTPGPGMSWDAATAYAKGVTVGGHNDWRLPNVKELATLIDFAILNSTDTANGAPCINQAFFPKASATSYWTSTKLHSPSGGKAWYVDFAGGNLRYDMFSQTNSVFAVRTDTPIATLPVGPNSYFHPEDVLTDQAANIPAANGKDRGPRDGPPARAERGGDAPRDGDLHLMPRDVEEKLNLSEEQRKQIDDLAKEAKDKLGKILTPEQMRILEESRPPRPGDGAGDGPDRPDRNGSRRNTN